MDLISIFCGFCLFVGIVLTAVKLYEVSIKKPFVSEIKLHGKTAIVTGANTGMLIHLCLLCKFIHVYFFVHQNDWNTKNCWITKSYFQLIFFETAIYNDQAIYTCTGKTAPLLTMLRLVIKHFFRSFSLEWLSVCPCHIFMTCFSANINLGWL